MLLRSSVLCFFILSGLVVSAQTDKHDVTINNRVKNTINQIKQIKDEIHMNRREKVVLFLGSTKSNQVFEALTEKKVGKHPIAYNLQGNEWYVNIPILNDRFKQGEESHQDIITSYVSQYVVRTAGFVKIVLVLDDLLRCDELLLFLKKLVNNVDEYKSSVSLLITSAGGCNETEIIPKNMESYIDLTQDELEYITHLRNALTERSQISITNTLIGRIKYTDLKNLRVGYPVSATTDMRIRNIVDEICKNLESSFINIRHDIREVLEEKSKKERYMQKYVESIGEEAKKIRYFVEKLRHEDLETYIQSFSNFMKEYIPIEVDMDYMQETIEHIAIMSQDTKPKLYFTLSNILDEVKKAFDEVGQWYKFLLDLKEELTSFKVQTNRSLFDVKELKDWGLGTGERGLIIDETNMEEFLTTMLEFFPKLRARYGDMKPAKNAEYIQEINYIIQTTLRTVTNIVREGETLYITGEFINFCEVRDITDSFSTDETIQTFSIMSTYDVYIDCDFIPPRAGQNISIFAPSWISDNTSYVVFLYGQDSPRYEDDNHGVNGRPGLPGGPAGNFLGVGDTTEDLRLLVFSYGGRGSDGEIGSDGYNGTDYVNNPGIGSACRYETRGHGSYENYTTNFFFDELACGGNGGDGGAPGYGGYGGNIDFVFSAQYATLIEKESRDGLPGNVGTGGRGGFGGRNDKYIEQYCGSDCSDNRNRTDEWYIYPPGKPGKDGASTFGQKEPIPKLGSSIFSTAIIYYQEYLERQYDKYASNAAIKFHQIFKENVRKLGNHHMKHN